MAQASASSIRYSSDIDMDRIYSRIFILDREERNTYGQRVLRFSDNTSRYTSNVSDSGIILWWKLGKKIMGPKITEETLGAVIVPRPTLYSVMPDGSKVERKPAYNIDVDFILETLEGTVRDKDTFIGHVPPVGKSGITIGFGFDLGQHNKQDLLKYNFPESLIKQFEPYLGKTRKNTDPKELDKLAKQLTVSANVADYISKSVLNYHEKKAEKEYNNYLEKLGKIELRKINRNYDNAWYKLPKSSKTILTQNSYLTGNISQYPTLMKSIISENPTKIKEAINLNTKYNSGRRDKLLSYVESSPYELPEMNIEIKERPVKPELPPSERDEITSSVKPDDPSITLNKKEDELY